MNLAILSDSHGHIEQTERAISMLRGMEIDAILHCGDIGLPDIIPLFDEWPTHFVFGNCDGDRLRLEKAIEVAQQTCHGEFGEFEFANKEIALLHSHDYEKFREVIESGFYDLVCYGHTHEMDCYRRGKTLILNPGALFRARPLSFAVVKLPSLEVEFHPLPE